MLSITLTGVIFLGELIGGIWTGSLALISDSAHVFLDMFALALSYAAYLISFKPADNLHTYGFHRFEVLAALLNGLSLVIISGGIFYEAIQRFLEPQVIRSGWMLIISVIGLVVNLVVAMVLHNDSQHEEPGKQDLNVHSAYMHVLGDAISSFGVILAAVLIMFTGMQWLDPAVSILIGIIIMVSSYRVIRGSVHILLEGTPYHLEVDEIRNSFLAIKGVEGVHDLHVWNICSGHIALSAHIVSPEADHELQAVQMVEIKQMLMQKFGIDHITIQHESAYCGSSQCE